MNNYFNEILPALLFIAFIIISLIYTYIKLSYRGPKVFDELKKQESATLKVSKPYVYITIK